MSYLIVIEYWEIVLAYLTIWIAGFSSEMPIAIEKLNSTYVVLILQKREIKSQRRIIAVIVS